MRRSRRRQINNEIAAVASLRESAIDLSDIPELRDWSQAVVGTFHRPRIGDALPIDSRVDAVKWPGQPAAGPQAPSMDQGHFVAPGSTRFRFWEMKNDLLVDECIRGIDDAWFEFVRRWRPSIVRAVTRTLRRWQNPRVDLVDNLVQDVYFKLAANNCKVLKELQSCKEEKAFSGLLKIVAVNVVQDHLRFAGTAKRAAGISSVHSGDAGSDDRPDNVERKLLLGEIDRILSRVASQRDLAIFSLYYRQGLTAKQIAEQPIGLTIKRVESVLLRLTRAIKQELVLAPKLQNQRAVGFELTRRDALDVLLRDIRRKD